MQTVEVRLQLLSKGKPKMGLIEVWSQKRSDGFLGTVSLPRDASQTNIRATKENAIN